MANFYDQSLAIPETTLTLNAGGYVNAVESDVGKTVVGGTTGDTGKLISYDNTARTWIVAMDNEFDEFDVSESIAISGGTGGGPYRGQLSRRLWKSFLQAENHDRRRDRDHPHG